MRPTSVLLHQAVASSAALFAKCSGQEVQIRIGTTVIIRGTNE
jgi:hypothetical protein